MLGGIFSILFVYMCNDRAYVLYKVVVTEKMLKEMFPVRWDFCGTFHQKFQSKT